MKLSETEQTIYGQIASVVGYRKAQRIIKKSRTRHSSESEQVVGDEEPLAEKGSSTSGSGKGTRKSRGSGKTENKSGSEG